MDEYGIHFPTAIETNCESANNTNLKRKREGEAQKKEARLAKLPPVNPELMPICCQRLCCCGAIAPAFLLDARSKYMDCLTQTTRKLFLRSLKDINSPTNFVLVKGSNGSNK
jgi:hypothetical protein